MKTILIRFGLLALILTGLSGCGGGSNGSAGAPGTPGTNGTNGAIGATAMTSDQWTTLKPNIDPASISVDMSSGTPVVKFKVTDQYGNAVVGLGGQSLSATNATAGIPAANYNISFTLAKLVTAPGAPSKWVNYLVTTPKPASTALSYVADGRTWVGTYPTAETQGTMVDNRDGTYQYTFLRDVTHVKNIVANLGQDATHVNTDLGELTYDATLTHRLGIFIAGSQPGTGTATSNAVLVTTAVPMVNTFNIGFDFVPNGSAVTVTRDIVKKDSCTECHQGRGIGHITSNSGITTNPANGVPAGAFIGRNDPRLCVTCHTDQTKYSFTNVVEANGVSGLPQSLTTVYMRTATGEAAFTYPRMIHKFHMGAQNGVVPGSGLVKTGYNLNGHCNNGINGPAVPGNITTAAPSNQAACFNQLQYPQDVRNCTKCHDGSTGAKNKTTDGDNWKNVPSRIACGACHDGIDFATGTGITLFDRDTDVAHKPTANPIGTTHSGHPAGSNVGYTDDTLCAGCHTAPSIAIVHGAIPVIINSAGALSLDPASGVEAANRMPASEAPSLRTMNATITGATISATDGSVTVNFTLTDSAGAAVDMPVAQQNVSLYPTATTTNVTGIPFKSLNFTLAKLVPAVNGASSYWKSYTGKCNVNNATANPNMLTSPVYHNVLQGYSEVAMGQVAVTPVGNSAGKPLMNPGILMSLGSGHWSYKFALVNSTTHNADGSGDINFISNAINLNTAAPFLADGVTSNPAAAYNWIARPTCPDDGSALAGSYAAGTYTAANYEPTLTHRIGMIFNKNDPLGADNVSNATYDFTPSGSTVAQTRNIVTMANCATCHGGRKIHKGYATELCVTCHNQNTSDPSDALATNTVDLQRIVHKLHYKGTDFTVHGEAFGTGSMTGFPGNVMKCQVCHNETAVKPATSTSDGKSSTAAGKALENAANWYTTPTSRACGTCHDDTIATAHINSQISGGVEMCVTCHGAGSVDGLDAKTAHGKRLP